MCKRQFHTNRKRTLRRTVPYNAPTFWHFKLGESGLVELGRTLSRRAHAFVRCLPRLNRHFRECPTQRGASVAPQKARGSGRGETLAKEPHYSALLPVACPDSGIDGASACGFRTATNILS